MRDIVYRERTVDDDVNTVLHLKADTKDSSDKTLIIPKPTIYPLVVWSKTNKNFHPKGVAVSELDKYVKECMNWPLTSEALCHNCCHSFTNIPVPLPYRYDKMRNIYKCRGIFCSWQCVKAYNLDTVTHVGRGEVNTNIALLAYRLWTKYLIEEGKEVVYSLQDYTRYCISPAPNKTKLLSFGGTLTIEEYRKGSFGIIPPADALEGKPLISVKNTLFLPFSNMENRAETYTDSNVEKSSNNHGNTMNTMVTSAVHKHANEFCDKLNRAKQEKVVIKRKRPDSTKNTLISSMGVKVAQRKR